MWILHSILYVQVGFALHINIILQKDFPCLSFTPSDVPKDTWAHLGNSSPTLEAGALF